MAAANQVQIIITAKDEAAKVFTQLQKRVDESFRGAGDSAEKANERVTSSTERMSTRTAALMGAVAGVVQSAVQKAASLVTDSIGSAIKRVDTLNNSARVFSNMGFGADETKKTVDTLTKSIQGLPTPLDAAIRNMQLIAASTNDLGKSQEIFSAMNNAILGFGGNTAMVDNAVIQLSQAFSNGRIDAETWNSMMNSGLGPTLNAIAEQMGITTGALKEGLSDGSISVERFQDELISMNTKGGGGLKSLEQIAKDSTAGIGTGMENMKTAISRGVASIIEGIGSENISSAISATGTAFETALKSISGAMKWIADNKDVIAPIAVSVGAAAAAFTAWKLAIATWNAVTKVATAVQTAFNLVMAANPIMLIVLAVVALVAGFIYLWNNVEGFRNFFIAVWEGIKTAVSGFVDFFKGIFNGIGEFFSGIWDGIKNIFTGFVDWIKEWGLTILAVIFFPFSLLLGLIIQNWDSIKAFFGGIAQWFSEFFGAIWDTIVAIFTPIIEFFKGIFGAAWEGIKTIWNAVTGFFKGVWDGIVSIFSVVSGWFKEIFQGAWNAIKNVFSPVFSFFKGIWDSITGIFNDVGSTIANAIGGAVKGAVNSALGVAEGAINGFIGLINGAIGIINNIPGVKIPNVGKVSFGRLATGTNFAQGGQYLVGENGAEMVTLPRGSKVMPAQRTANYLADNQQGRTVNINVKAEVKNDVDLYKLASQMGYMVSQT